MAIGDSDGRAFIGWRDVDAVGLGCCIEVVASRSCVCDGRVIGSSSMSLLIDIAFLLWIECIVTFFFGWDYIAAGVLI